MQKAKSSQNNKGIVQVQVEFDLGKGMKANGQNKCISTVKKREGSSWLCIESTVKIICILPRTM